MSLSRHAKLNRIILKKYNISFIKNIKYARNIKRISN